MKRFFLAFFAGAILLSMISSVTFAEEKNVTVQEGKTVTIDYVLTVEGKEVDSTKANGPMKYVHGKSSLIPGFTKGIEGMSVGDEKKIEISPEGGYGDINPEAFRTVNRTELPEEVEPAVGAVLEARTKDNKSFPVTIIEVKEDVIVLDYNHPLAGKTLNFNVKVRAID